MVELELNAKPVLEAIDAKAIPDEPKAAKPDEDGAPPKLNAVVEADDGAAGWKTNAVGAGAAAGFGMPNPFGAPCWAGAPKTLPAAPPKIGAAA